MPRIKVHITGKSLAVIHVPVRITDLNYGNHVGNDSIVSILHEARVQWLAMHKFTELDMGGASLIMAGIAVEYVNECFYGDNLSIALYSGILSNAGFELYYDLRCHRHEKEIVIGRAKTEMVFYDYSERKVIGVPEAAKRILV